jgi:hypothetical protein
MAVKWQTLSGNLGTIANGNVVSNTLIAISNQSFEVTYSNLSTEVISPNIHYTLIAGSLPSGLSLANDLPNNQATISGTATRENVTSFKSFTVRATEYIFEPNTTINDSNITLTIADRTFGYFCIGQTAPITSNTTLTNVNIGSYYEYQLTVDNDATNVNWTLLDSTIHPNLSLLSNGLIRGYVSPTNSSSFTYNIQASNSIGSSSAAYEIPVTTPNVSDVYSPFITTDSGLIASQRRGTYLYEIIKSHDYNGNVVTFLFNGNIPDGISINNFSNTCIISGEIENVGFGTLDYNFTLTPTKNYVNGNTVVVRNGDSKNFTITVLGRLDDTPIWQTSSDLGVLTNRLPSELFVEVKSNSGLEFTYRLAPYSNPLPEGLSLMTDGTIIGKIKTDIPDGTSIRFSFEVEASSIRETVYKEFILTIEPKPSPSRNLYGRMMPKIEKRFEYDRIVGNVSIIPESVIYRRFDPWYGVNKYRRFLFAAGLQSKAIHEYIETIESNHYWKNLRLGEIKSAEALDNNLNPIYEIVYAEIIDEKKDEDEVNEYVSTTLSNGSVRQWQTNSFEVMTKKFRDNIGYEDTGTIPRWMLSRQSNGIVLGFKIVFPIVYVKPGKAQQVISRLQNYKSALGSIEFILDRYEFDGNEINAPEPVLIIPKQGTIIKKSNIVGESSFTFSSDDYTLVGTNKTNLTLTDGVKIQFGSGKNSGLGEQDLLSNMEDLAYNTFVVTGVNNSIQLINVNDQVISTNNTSPYIIGNNTIFKLLDTPNSVYNDDPERIFIGNQLHVGDYITSGNIIVGQVEEIISNTNIKLTANATQTLSNVGYKHTSWIPKPLPVDGDKYLIFPNVQIKEYRGTT